MSARDQIRWMREYMRRCYGPESAADETPGWYGRGGSLPPGITLARNDTSEPEDVDPGGDDGAS